MTTVCLMRACATVTSRRDDYFQRYFDAASIGRAMGILMILSIAHSGFSASRMMLGIKNARLALAGFGRGSSR